MSAAPITLAAPAKVNLYLGVGARRDDGYHDVETVMQALELHDTVTLTPADALTVACEPDVGVPGERNLAARAATALAQRLGRPPAFAIHLTKRIPAGGGLGGGSSDAAAVLAGLALAWGLDADDPILAEVGSALGADVPFFLTGGCALMTGRGDELAARLPVVPMHIVVVNPGIPVPTADAYAVFDAAPSAPSPGTAGILAALDSGDPAQVAGSLHDNLTGPVTGLVPAVADALAFVSGRDGVLGTCMSGSGSSVFGVFTDEDAAGRTAQQARDKGWWSVATRSRSGGVERVPADGEVGE